jgi:VanZ family protein
MKPFSMSPSRWRALFCLSVLAVLILSLIPPVPHMPTTGWDKSNHLLAFAVMAMLGRRAYPGRTVRVLLGLLAYGVLIEILQSLTPDRMAEWADLLADSLGLALAVVLNTIAKRIRQPRRLTPDDTVR